MLKILVCVISLTLFIIGNEAKCYDSNFISANLAKLTSRQAIDYEDCVEDMKNHVSAALHHYNNRHETPTASNFKDKVIEIKKAADAIIARNSLYDENCGDLTSAQKNKIEEFKNLILLCSEVMRTYFGYLGSFKLETMGRSITSWRCWNIKKLGLDEKTNKCILLRDTSQTIEQINVVIAACNQDSGNYFTTELDEMYERWDEEDVIYEFNPLVVNSGNAKQVHRIIDTTPHRISVENLKTCMNSI